MPEAHKTLTFLSFFVSQRYETRMEMAKVKGLFQRNGYWWARKDVPPPLREIVGQTSFQKPLGTSDIKVALIQFPAVLTEFETTLTKARDKLAGKPDSVESIREAMANVVIRFTRLAGLLILVLQRIGFL